MNECILCGESPELSSISFLWFNRVYYYCERCGHRGPLGASDIDAMNNWNKCNPVNYMEREDCIKVYVRHLGQEHDLGYYHEDSMDTPDILPSAGEIVNYTYDNFEVSGRVQEIRHRHDTVNRIYKITIVVG